MSVVIPNQGTAMRRIPMLVKKPRSRLLNKVAPPFKEAFVEIMYGEGISKTGELIKIATDGYHQKAGACSNNDENRSRI